MAFLQRSSGNLHELAVLLQLLNGCRAAVSHTGPQAAHKLEYRILHGSLICHASFHAFRNQLLRVLLEIAVLAAVLHRRNGAHPAVYLILSSLIQLKCSRAFIASRENASHHAYIGACRDRFRHISGILDTAVRNDRDPIFSCCTVAVHHRRDLGNTDSRNHTGGTNRTRSDPHLHRINSGFDQCSCRIGCCHISRNDLKLRELFLDHADCLQHVGGMPVSGIHDNHIHLGIHKRLHTFQAVGCNSDGRAAEQTPLGILRGRRVLDLLLNVLDGDQPFQVAVFIHDRKLFLSCLCKDLLCFVQCDPFAGCDQSLGGHAFFDFLGEICFEF